jgi:hypothetical protein
VPFERGQHRQRFEIGLLARAVAAVVRQVALEYPDPPAGLGRREPEDAQMHLVVADHVDEVAPSHDPACRGQIRGAAGFGRLL